MERRATEFTYEWLTAYQQETNEFRIFERGEGMQLYHSFRINNLGQILLNTATRKAYPVVWPDGVISVFTIDDIDLENVERRDTSHLARDLKANYAFGVEAFSGGVALVSWMLWPDGSYFADEDGFGREDCDELCIYGVIDRNCRPLVKFQLADTFEERDALLEEARRRLREGG